MVGQSLHDIGNTDFEDDVHTTLEVQTQADAHFTALLEGPGTEVHFLVLQRVEIVLRCSFALYGCNLLGLAFIVADHP